MECALLLALICAVSCSAVSYVDYSEVKMPQYGSNAEYETGRDPLRLHPSEDYHGHSPDAPASLDYKYEEEPHIKTENPINLDDSDAWRKFPRKQKEFIRSAENGNMRKRFGRDDYDDDEEVPKTRSNRRFPKHRSRLKSEDDDVSEEQMSSRRHNKYSHDRKDVSDIDKKDYFHIDKDYIRGDKNKEFGDDIKFRETTIKKANRRKPRDRQFKRQQKSNLLEEYEKDLEVDRQNMSDFENENKDSRSNDETRRQRPTEENITPKHILYQSSVDEEDDTKNNPAKISSGKNKQKGYDEYEYYYDMKRAHNIKNKLPVLLRRTTVRESATNTHLLDMLLTNQRLMVTTLETASPTRTPPAMTASSTQTTSMTTIIPVKSTTTITIKTELNNKDMSFSRDLSLAEKSRLSILKKAQRKEGMSFHSTKKPPVLLQVTSHMPTVVIVEPPSPSMPWMRAKEFVEDSPERIDKVKQLMRHKLVAEAKSIHDLTDNWDEMVCDYIDTSLLENKSMMFPSNAHFLIFLLHLYVFVIN